MGAVQAPLLLAAQNDMIGLLMRSPAFPTWPTAVMRRFAGPAVVLIGDDPASGEGASLGPDEWTCLLQVKSWAPVSALICASGADSAHYQMAVLAALIHRRVIIVETASRHGIAWCNAIGCANTLAFMPRDGEHPIVADRVVH
jgi:hypothetical protein